MNADGSGAELYNIEQDQEERQDRKSDSPEVAKRLSARLAQWIAGLPAPGPAVRRAM